jgi:hypothetical protein
MKQNSHFCCPKVLSNSYKLEEKVRPTLWLTPKQRDQKLSLESFLTQVRIDHSLLRCLQKKLSETFSPNEILSRSSNTQRGEGKRKRGRGCCGQHQPEGTVSFSLASPLSFRSRSASKRPWRPVLCHFIASQRI